MPSYRGTKFREFFCFGRASERAREVCFERYRNISNTTDPVFLTSGGTDASGNSFVSGSALCCLIVFSVPLGVTVLDLRFAHLGILATYTRK